MEKWHSTTIVAVQKDGITAMAGDGQVSTGSTILKGTAKKVRRMYDGKVLAGFAGATADAFTLLELFESKLQAYGGNLMRSAVELAKDWRTDRILRRLEAMMIVTDGNDLLLLTGNGDVVDADEKIVAIGSGGNFALAAARALYRNTKLSAEEIAKESLKIASEICVYTNDQVILETVKGDK
ncbi:MAG: ATP-dependent protease subunit HslV [Candidatus Hydrogenedentota bacterium]|nr:MAG: ATP-dependent protease subunit HslV [Candidatus Hydrogenedentota bacterium]